ncbi:MAG: discoidin domain-containing protein, partial [Oscillospiraceae bacterium]|nr:discoidin domain-containing protein [Oscillospiraceae bacterium]
MKAAIKKFLCVLLALCVIDIPFTAPTRAADVNVAQNKPATASRTQPDTDNGSTFNTYAPGKAFDGLTNTRWSASNASYYGLSDTEEVWLAVDLGAQYTLTGIRLNWETARSNTYRIQVSDTGEEGTYVTI